MSRFSNSLGHSNYHLRSPVGSRLLSSSRLSISCNLLAGSAFTLSRPYSRETSIMKLSLSMGSVMPWYAGGGGGVCFCLKSFCSASLLSGAAMASGSESSFSLRSGGSSGMRCQKGYSERGTKTACGTVEVETRSLAELPAVFSDDALAFAAQHVVVLEVLVLKHGNDSEVVARLDPVGEVVVCHSSTKEGLEGLDPTLLFAVADNSWRVTTVSAMFQFGADTQTYLSY